MKDDLISRSALLDCSYSIGCATWDRPYDGESVVSVDDIENAPAIDAITLVYGVWDEQSDGTHFCTNCGYDAPYTYDGNEFTPSFCCHCGALMISKEDAV